MDSLKIGDTVKMIDSSLNIEEPQFYPKKNTKGKVTGIDGVYITVQWEKGSTSRNDCWCISCDEIQKVEVPNG
jgi:hypothetical protein